jgi:hypothetical protein
MGGRSLIGYLVFVQKNNIAVYQKVSAVIYVGKTVINTVDAITPDVVDKKK